MWDYFPCKLVAFLGEHVRLFILNIVKSFFSKLNINLWGEEEWLQVLFWLGFI